MEVEQAGRIESIARRGALDKRSELTGSQFLDRQGGNMEGQARRKSHRHPEAAPQRNPRDIAHIHFEVLGPSEHARIAQPELPAGVLGRTPSHRAPLSLTTGRERALERRPIAAHRVDILRTDKVDVNVD